MFSRSFFIIFLIINLSCKNNLTSGVEEKPSLSRSDSKKNKNLKLGFTIQNFLKINPVSLKSSKKMIDYAVKKGFVWLELRDPDASLSKEECKKIASYGRKRNVEIAYAIQKGILDEDFWLTFKKGIENAALFKGPKTFRALAGGQEFTNNPDKIGWDERELQKIISFADSAAILARENGLQFVLENGTEPLYGKEGKYFGFADVLEGTGFQVGWQFDTANPFAVSRTKSSPESVMSFLKDNVYNLSYIHLKSSEGANPQTILMDNPLAFGKIFNVLSEAEIPYVAIELQAVDDEEKAYENMAKSVLFLQEKNLLTNFFNL